jgi:hypothetical protein
VRLPTSRTGRFTPGRHGIWSQMAPKSVWVLCRKRTPVAPLTYKKDTVPTEILDKTSINVKCMLELPVCLFRPWHLRWSRLPVAQCCSMPCSYHWHAVPMLRSSAGVRSLERSSLFPQTVKRHLDRGRSIPRPLLCPTPTATCHLTAITWDSVAGAVTDAGGRKP